MIRWRTVAGLWVLGAASLAGGWAISRPPQSGMLPPRPALPTLTQQLPVAARVTIAQEAHTVTLERRGQSWTLAERSGYPVKQDMVHELLDGLAELRLMEPRTADPALLGRLGLDDAGTRIAVLAADGSPIGAVIAGHVKMRAAGPAELYLRLVGQPQSWLAQGTVPASANPEDWLGHDILTIDPAQVIAVRFTRGDDVLALRRNGGGVTVETPADAPPVDAAHAANTFAALSHVSFTDVRPAAQVHAAPIGTAQFTLRDGTVITATVGSAEGAVWTQFAAAGPQAGALQARLAGWSFAFPEWMEATFLPLLSTLEAQ